MATPPGKMLFLKSLLPLISCPSVLSEQTEHLGSEAAADCQAGTEPRPAWRSLIHHSSPEGEKLSSTGAGKRKGSDIQFVVLASHETMLH